MLLAIDVGNTNTVLGLMPESGEPLQSWRLSLLHLQRYVHGLGMPRDDRENLFLGL